MKVWRSILSERSRTLLLFELLDFESPIRSLCLYFFVKRSDCISVTKLSERLGLGEEKGLL